MSDRYYLRFYQFLHANKKWVLASFVLVTLLAATGVFFVSYEGTINIMLPPDKKVVQSLDFLRDASFSDKVILSLALRDPKKTKKDLFHAADTLAASLAPPLFTSAITGFSFADVMEEFSLLQYAPQIFGEQDFKALDKKINPQAVSSRLHDIYQQSFRFESIFLSSFSRTDPIGIQRIVLEKLRALPASLGYDVMMEDGHFISKDGRHAMIIIQTSVPMTDGRRSRELIAALQDHLQHLPAYVTADIVSGHIHTVRNEEVIKQDITVAATIASFAFLFLFLFVFRDLRALFVFILPVIAVIWAIVIIAFVQDTLSYLIIGFGTAIVGISDYGLVVYIAMKQGTDISQSIQLAKLVFIDAITTIFSFVVLFFSAIHGYHQLALFSVLCLTLCLLFSMAVLPLILDRRQTGSIIHSSFAAGIKMDQWPAKRIVVIWSVLTAVFLVLAFFVQFDSDVKKLDGSGPEVLKTEQRFHEVWGGKSNQAILVVTGGSLEEAMEKNDQVFADVQKRIGAEHITNIASFWPSEKKRKENVQTWDRFWNEGREKKLRELIRQASARYEFSDQAFAPFFQGLYAHRVENAVPEGIIAHLQKRFVTVQNGEYRVLTFFPDEQRFLDALSTLPEQYPGTFLVSGKMLSSFISDFTAKEIRILAPLAVLFNVVFAWFFFRNWQEVLIALIPLITGVIWLIGIMALFNTPLNVITLVAVIITTGVIIDYGLGMTYEYGQNMNFGTIIAVTLSAASNIIGAGALLFAKHPALYSTAVAMVICMTAAYISAIVVIPSFCRIMKTGRREVPLP
ncbi:MAG: hypothetical protein WC539_03615 [Nitrospirota bacterium]